MICWYDHQAAVKPWLTLVRSSILSTSTPDAGGGLSTTIQFPLWSFKRYFERFLRLFAFLSEIYLLEEIGLL